MYHFVYRPTMTCMVNVINIHASDCCLMPSKQIFSNINYKNKLLYDEIMMPVLY